MCKYGCAGEWDDHPARNWGWTKTVQHHRYEPYLLTQRYYDPSTGKFASRDPIGTAGGENLYGYAGDDPVNEVDPSGRGPLGDWIDRVLLGGSISNWGSVQGRYDSGQATKAQLVLAGTNGVAQTALLAYSVVDGAAIARAGARMVTEKLAARAAARGVAELSARNAARMAGVRAAGRAGEAAAGIVKNTTHIRALVSGASYRIPDVLDMSPSRLLIGEVKNVAELNYSNQMADFAEFARQKGLTLEYYVRAGTKIAPKVQSLVSNGTITIVRILK